MGCCLSHDELQEVHAAWREDEPESGKLHIASTIVNAWSNHKGGMILVSFASLYELISFAFEGEKIEIQPINFYDRDGREKACWIAQNIASWSQAFAHEELNLRHDRIPVPLKVGVIIEKNGNQPFGELGPQPGDRLRIEHVSALFVECRDQKTGVLHSLFRSLLIREYYKAVREESAS